MEDEEIRADTHAQKEWSYENDASDASADAEVTETRNPLSNTSENRGTGESNV
jgi:hypothetical protein